MISGVFHTGSGLGNQLHRYVFTRVKALDLGVDFGMENPELFKGHSFLNLDMGKPVEGVINLYNEPRVINDSGHDVRPYDPMSELIEDNTEVDGEFQDPKYFMHRIDEIEEWLTTGPLYFDNETCVINFRGGEYVGVKELFLPKEYWDTAIKYMRTMKPNIKFVVVTDDVAEARRFFPEFEITHDLINDWQSIRWAQYLILANSSFAILPALLNENARMILAPKFWAGYNKGYWQLQQNQYDKFTYIHHDKRY